MQTLNLRSTETRDRYSVEDFKRDLEGLFRDHIQNDPKKSDSKLFEYFLYFVGIEALEGLVDPLFAKEIRTPNFKYITTLFKRVLPHLSEDYQLRLFIELLPPKHNNHDLSNFHQFHPNTAYETGVFLSMYAQYFSEHPEQWENRTLVDFWEALDTLVHYPGREKEKYEKGDLTWNDLANLFRRARVQE